MLQPTTVAVRSHDADLRVHDFGAGDPLILVHGYTGSSIDWADVAPVLADHGRRVITYDHRGHGESTNTGDATTYRFDQMAEDLGAVADHFGFDRFDLLGHSMGGVISEIYVLEHPERVRSMILMDTSGEPMRAMPEDVVNGFAQHAMEHGMASLRDQLAPMFEAGESRWPEETRDVMRERGRTKFVQMDPVAFATLGVALGRYDSMLDRLARLEIPVTVMVGALDTGLLDASKTLADTIPGAVLEIVDDAGHCPNEDRPDEWVRLVEAHLARV